jgi:hypothetical protein
VKDSSITRIFQIIAWALFGLVLVIILLGVIAAAVEDIAGGRRSADPSDIIPTVVNIICPDSSQELNLDSVGQGGSGVVMTREGMIYTNAHIFQDEEGETIDLHPEGCIVMVPNNETGYPEEIYYAQPTLYGDTGDYYDLATLQVYNVFSDDDGPWGQYPKRFETLSADVCIDEPLQLGESMKIFGYPEATGGITLTVTEGVVSSFSEDGYVLTSAKINYGNSGGLAVDARGCFIGIASAFIEDSVENYGIIIPANLIEEFENEAGIFEEASL